MALAGDRVRIIDRRHPLFREDGATGTLVSGDFRGRYLATIDPGPSGQARGRSGAGGDPPVRTELAECQFVVLPAAGLGDALFRRGAAAGWFDPKLSGVVPIAPAKAPLIGEDGA